jgi:metal-sulfur cluster biosynthetic enzyme
MTDRNPTSERSSVSEADVESALEEIIDPCSASRGTNHSVIEMGLLKSIDINEGAVTVNMRLTSPACFMIPYFIRQTEEIVGALDGVESVELTTDAGMEWSPDMMSDDAKKRREKYLEQLEERYQTENTDQRPAET